MKTSQQSAAHETCPSSTKSPCDIVPINVAPPTTLLHHLFASSFSSNSFANFNAFEYTYKAIPCMEAVLLRLTNNIFLPRLFAYFQCSRLRRIKLKNWARSIHLFLIDFIYTHFFGAFILSYEHLFCNTYRLNFYLLSYKNQIQSQDICFEILASVFL